MPKPPQQKCRRCAYLSAEEVQQRHGPNGDGCWDSARCPQRRYYYRNRDRLNRDRRQAQGGKMLTLSPPVAAPAAVLYLYRQQADAPLHGIGAELWLGQTPQVKVAPIHCLGLSQRQVMTCMTEILQRFSDFSGQKITKFTTCVDLEPESCPIRPCPLHPTEGKAR